MVRFRFSLGLERQMGDLVSAVFCHLDLGQMAETMIKTLDPIGDNPSQLIWLHIVTSQIPITIRSFNYNTR